MGTAILRGKWLRLCADAVILVCALFGMGLILFQNGGFHLDMFAYFTSVSCLLTAVFCGVSLAEDIRAVRGAPLRVFPRLSLLCTVFELFTLAFTATLILPNYLMYGAGFGYIGEVMVYYAVPLLVLVRWILFTPHGGIRWIHPLFSAAIPFGYFLYTVLLAVCGATYESGSSTAHFPYFFLDPEKYAFGDVLANLLFVLLIFLALGYLLYGLDKLCWLPVRKYAVPEETPRGHKRRKPGRRELRAASRVEKAAGKGTKTV